MFTTKFREEIHKYLVRCDIYAETEIMSILFFKVAVLFYEQGSAPVLDNEIRHQILQLCRAHSGIAICTQAEIPISFCQPSAGLITD